MQRAKTTIILNLPETDIAEFRGAAHEHRTSFSAWVQHACYAAIARRAVQRIASDSLRQASGTDAEVQREDEQLRSQRTEIELSDSDVAEFTAAAAADGDGNLPHWITRQCYAADAPRRFVRDRGGKLEGQALEHALQAVIDLGHPPKPDEHN